LCPHLISSSRQIRNALKPNGKFVVIDFHRDDAKITSRPKGWVMDHVRGTQEEFRKEIESAGFRLVAEPVIEGMTENYCMVFTPN
jgi:predicted methyltransferase